NFCTFHQFFTYATATTAIYTLSLHDALPISNTRRGKKSPPNYPSIAALCIDWYSVAWAEHGLSALRRQNGWEELQISVAQSAGVDRKSTRLNSSHVAISYAVFCLKKKKNRYQ